MSTGVLFDALARRRSDDVVFCGTDGKWRVSEVEQEIEELADRLADSRVLAIYADNSPDWAIADLAALKAATVVLPLPLFFSKSQLTHALVQSATDLVLTDQPERILDLNLGFTVGEKRRNLFWLRREVEPIELPAGTAKISFTSGSTGLPKGVCLSGAGLLETAHALCVRLSDIGIARHLAVLPLAVLLENNAGIYAPLLRGAEIHLPALASIGWRGMAGFDPQALHRKVTEVHPDSLILVPELLKSWSLFLVHSGQRAPDGLSYVAVGGSHVEANLMTQARQLGVPAYQGYGLTECGSVVSLNRPGDDGKGVGRPLPHVRVTIRDGEIHVATPAFLGYLGDPPFTSFEYPTGDLGNFEDTGRLHLSGRRKNLLITSFGRNISPEWVEAALLAQPQIAQAVVVGDNQAVLGAIVVPLPGLAAADLAAAIVGANEVLPDYARVGPWLTVEPFLLQNGLLTGNGRPVRAAILNQYAAALVALYGDQFRQYAEESVHVVL